MKMTVLQFKKKDVIELLSKIPVSAEIHLVGDQGVYLMSFQDEAKEGEERTVAYAIGTNPHLDADFYQMKRDLYGGDDGADIVGTAKELADIVIHSGRFIYAILTETQIALTNKNPLDTNTARNYKTDLEGEKQ